MTSQVVESTGVKNIITPADVAEIFLKAKIHKRYESPFMKTPFIKTGNISLLLGNLNSENNNSAHTVLIVPPRNKTTTK